MMLIIIIYFNKLSKDRDLFFESQCLLFLKHIKKIYVHIMNVSFYEMQMKNDINLFIIIFYKIRLNQLKKYE